MGKPEFEALANSRVSLLGSIRQSKEVANTIHALVRLPTLIHGFDAHLTLVTNLHPNFFTVSVIEILTS
jgi:hypothetical protein